MSYIWYEAYKAVVLETDGEDSRSNQSAECEINDRQRELSEDHGGTPRKTESPMP